MKSKIAKVLGRVLPFLLTLTITVSALLCMTVSASAAEYDISSGWYDLMDYSTLQNTNTYWADTNTFLLFDLPFESDVYAVDIIISITPTGPEYPSVPILDGNNCDDPAVSTIGLKMIEIGENLFRLYGSVDDYPFRAPDTLELSFLSVPYPCYLEFQSFRVSKVQTNSFADVGSIILNSDGGYTQGSMADEFTRFSCIHYSENVTDFSCSIYTSQWRKYDYIEFLITAGVDSINSISCYNGQGDNFPVYVDYLDNQDLSRVTFIARIDISNADRSSDTNSPVILIRGSGSGNLEMSLLNVTGYIFVDPPSPEVYWWTKLFNNIESWFSNLGKWLSDGFQSVVDAISTFVSGSPEQQQQVADAVDKMEQSSEALGQLGDHMNSVEKPAPSDMNVSPNAMIPDTALTAYTAPITYLWHNSTLVAMLTIVVTLVLVSWVFFGKKV